MQVSIHPINGLLSVHHNRSTTAPRALKPMNVHASPLTAFSLSSSSLPPCEDSHLSTYTFEVQIVPLTITWQGADLSQFAIALSIFSLSTFFKPYRRQPTAILPSNRPALSPLRLSLSFLILYEYTFGLFSL